MKPGTTAKTTDGETIKQENTTLGRVDAKSEKMSLEAKQTAVLLSKRQAISDMLGHEAVFYLDKTVKWLGSSADRVFADQELSFKKKEEALDELTRMVDEEWVISDADRAEFENKYFKDTREHRHL